MAAGGGSLGSGEARRGMAARFRCSMLAVHNRDAYPVGYRGHSCQ